MNWVDLPIFANLLYIKRKDWIPSLITTQQSKSGGVWKHFFDGIARILLSPSPDLDFLRKSKLLPKQNYARLQDSILIPIFGNMMDCIIKLYGPSQP